MRARKAYQQKNKIKLHHSIRRQFALIFISLLAGSFVLCWFLNDTFLERYYISKKAKNINSVYERINLAITSDSIDVANLEGTMRMGFQNNIITVILDVTNNLLIASPNGGEEFKGVVLRYRYGYYRYKIEADVVGRFIYQGEQQSRLDNTEYLGRFGTLANGSTYLICTPIPSIQESVEIANRFLAYTGIGMMLIGGIIIWMVTKKVTDPILELASISERMTNLDFDAKYHSPNKRLHNEVALLGDNINQLSDSLEKTISELKTANNELMRDIEKKEKIDEMRQEFISNVSHELKTPIALIQGYAEGLVEGVNDDPESMKFYCDVIMDEAGKMNRMVRKLLTLNQLEFGSNTVSMERFDVVTLIRNYIQSAQILTKQNGIEVRMAEYAPIYVWGDEYLTEEVFMNYFTNAVNHCTDMRGNLPETGADEIRVRADGSSTRPGKIIDIRLEIRENKVRVMVFNTGEMIPEESLPHLWEKFYKVDKARTREYGGSGVGLSIVKAIMESMNQTYGVQNYTNGVLFWFELELCAQGKDGEN